MSSPEKQKYSPPMLPVLLEEQKLRHLATELAKDIADPADVLKALELTDADYQFIKDTRAFKVMYQAALAEWHGAGNVQKRVKFKSAAMIEEVLPVFYQDITNPESPLSAKVELLKTIAKFGSIGNPEPVLPGNNGQFFKLEIHLSGKPDPIVVGGPTIEGELTESRLVEGEEYDEF
jgi:hypothetical protein